jgi:hypothetical protein
MRELPPPLVEKFGKVLRAQVDMILIDPLPDHWTALIERLDAVDSSNEPGPENKTNAKS